MDFKPNVGGLDLVIRLMVGLTAGYLVFINKTIVRDPVTLWILGFLSVVFILTAIFRYCPLYLLIDVNTHKSGQD